MLRHGILSSAWLVGSAVMSGFWLAACAAIVGPVSDRAAPDASVVDGSSDVGQVGEGSDAFDVATDVSLDTTVDGNSGQDSTPEANSGDADAGSGDADAGDAGSGDAGSGDADAGDADAATVEAGPACNPDGGDDGKACAGDLGGTCAGVVCTGPMSCTLADGGAAVGEAGGSDGLNTCGPAGHESCCTSLHVPGGAFHRTYTHNGSTVPTSEADPASVSSYRLDKYLVTVGRFRRFMAAVTDIDGGWIPDAGTGKHVHLNAGLGLVDTTAVLGSQPVTDDGGEAGVPGPTYESGWDPAYDNELFGSTAFNQSLGFSSVSDTFKLDTPYQTWTDVPDPDHEDLPINGVDWYTAYAFCIWDGGFLPSDTELEYAMAGGASETQYPWGFTNPGTSNDFAIYGDGAGNCYYPNPEGGVGAPCVGWENFAPVGTAQLGAGTWGQLDLSGSLFEWTLDWYLSYETPCVDCANLTYACQGGCGSASADRAMRGGAFNWDSTYLVPTNRFHYNPWNIWYAIGVGFRCARVP